MGVLLWPFCCGRGISKTAHWENSLSFPFRATGFVCNHISPASIQLWVWTKARFWKLHPEELVEKLHQEHQHCTSTQSSHLRSFFSSLNICCNHFKRQKADSRTWKPWNHRCCSNYPFESKSDKAQQLEILCPWGSGRLTHSGKWHWTAENPRRATSSDFPAPLGAISFWSGIIRILVLQKLNP